MPTTPPTAPAVPPVDPVAAARARLAPPTPRPGAPVIVREIARGPVELPRIAITFDAGVSRPQYTVPILDTLRSKGVRSTMFITGEWAQANPDLVRRMVADGHELANHSLTHADPVTLSNEGIRYEIRRCEEIVAAITGQTTKPLYRPPYGSRDVRVLDVIEDEGYYDIYWTLDSGDWIEGATAGQVYNKTVGGARNGAIIVMHITTEPTMHAIGPIIDALRANGFELVTVSELLAPPPGS